MSHCDITKYGSASCAYILASYHQGLLYSLPLLSHIKKQSKLQFYVLQTNQWFISRLMVHVLKVSKIVIMFSLTMYLIQTQTRGSMHEAGEYGYGSEWVSASVDQHGSSKKRMR